MTDYKLVLLSELIVLLVKWLIIKQSYSGADSSTGKNDWLYNNSGADSSTG